MAHVRLSGSTVISGGKQGFYNKQTNKKDVLLHLKGDTGEEKKNKKKQLVAKPDIRWRWPNADDLAMILKLCGGAGLVVELEGPQHRRR